jgi:UPF0755 protein
VRVGRARAYGGAAAAGVVVGLAIVLVLRWLLAAPAPGAGGSVEFRVESGESFASVAARLADEGLVRSAGSFRALARLTGRDREVRAGTYRVGRGASPWIVLRKLVEGREVLRRITVREGGRLDEIAAEVESVLGIPADRLLAEASSAERREALGCPAPTLEGYLFPETYLFPDGATAADVVDGMTGRFLEVWESLPPPDRTGLGRHEVVTLASIVEAETPLVEEMPRVAAVYLNRLDRGWLLQADPTVRYGLGMFDGRLLYGHLEIDTPYNTYRNPGLPPGPIGAPGRAALEAVRSPLEPCEDLFFVASGEGGHVFSRTKAEHDRAVREARRRTKAASGPG